MKKRKFYPKIDESFPQSQRDIYPSHYRDVTHGNYYVCKMIPELTPATNAKKRILNNLMNQLAKDRYVDIRRQLVFFAKENVKRRLLSLRKGRILVPMNFPHESLVSARKPHRHFNGLGRYRIVR